MRSWLEKLVFISPMPFNHLICGEDQKQDIFLDEGDFRNLSFHREAMNIFVSPVRVKQTLAAWPGRRIYEAG